MRWALVAGGLFVHVVFFYSIFDIYFTSPLTQGMTPHQNPLPPPADRLVLFVADGLRADKLFELKEDGTSRAPFLREKMERDGAWGVSHTRVPTESRPGHVALIAGFYEDVSAVAKGWKENPVEFDSVFNQSRFTWSWGSPDILPMFAKGATGDHVFTKMYPGASEDFAGSNLHKLDDWVFDNVKTLLSTARDDAELEAKVRMSKIVFFLHLLGLDTNGHAHKPYSMEYLENIAVVDRGIAEISAQIEEFYGHDNRTAYVFSSDHGMTNWGSHGAGHPSETLTPLVAWGAGVRGVRPPSTQYSDSFSKDWRLEGVERVDVNQADICPLMAALVGIPYPLNSVGTLPIEYLDAVPEFKAESIYTNALEILEQFQIKMREKQETTLTMLFTPYKSLLPSVQADMVRNIRGLIQSGHFEDAMKDSQELIELALKGLNYYHNYDRFFLGLSIALGFLGWMAYVITMILRSHTTITQHYSHLDSLHGPFWSSEKGIRLIFITLGGVISLLLYVQSLPWTYYLYSLLPVVLWHKVVQRSAWLRDLWWYTVDHGLLTQAGVMAFLGVAGLEIIVMSFFRRELLSIGLVGMGVWPLCTPLRERNRGTVIGWLLSCLVVAVFPILPVIGRSSNYSYVIMAGTVAILFAVTFAVSPEKLGLRSKSSSLRPNQHVKLLTYCQVVILLVSVYNVYKTSSSLSRREGLPVLNQTLSWAILVSSFIQPMLSSSKMFIRLVSISLAFTAPYILLSTSHEGFFLISLCVLLYFWIQIETQVAGSSLGKPQDLDFSSDMSLLGESHRKLALQDLRCAYFFIYFLLIGFFGTGNIASINTFDPSSILCFLTVFNPFVMGALMLWKILIPLLLVSCAFNAIHLAVNVPTQSLFLLVILMSDFMGLHFFFLVRDYGSWLEIGTSISHYVIVMSMIFFLILLLLLSKLFTNVLLVRGSKMHGQ